MTTAPCVKITPVGSVRFKRRWRLGRMNEIFRSLRQLCQSARYHDELLSESRQSVLGFSGLRSL
jgi:hypothetical protein